MYYAWHDGDFISALGSEKVLIILLVVLSCLFAFSFIAQYSKAEHTYAVFLKEYPETIDEGKNLAFAVGISTLNFSSRNVAVLIDGAIVEQRTISGAQELTFNIENNFKSGESHTVKILFYDNETSYLDFNSKAWPYYLFFEVKVL